MQLAEAIRKDGLTLAQVAAGIGVANSSVVRRYRDGERIPQPKVMRQIVVYFRGQVMPNDFYDLPKAQLEAAA